MAIVPLGFDERVIYQRGSFQVLRLPGIAGER